MPTRNSAALLQKHLARMKGWLDLVEQVVVVDSFSTDGTRELIQTELHHPHLVVLNHPPGLYQSWNYAISKISSEYVYISTCGDLITRTGLKRLFDAAEESGCDVVVSKPRFYCYQTNDSGEHTWPIDDIIATLNLTEPRRLNRLEALIFAITNVTAAMTGSCASDLFRTAVLQQYPFPTDFGTAGDAAWGILHAAEVSWVVTPERFSRFLRHPSIAPESERCRAERALQPDRLARQAVARLRLKGLLSEEELAFSCLDELLDILEVYLDYKRACDEHRRGKLPWISRPSAWRARFRRRQAEARLGELKFAALQRAKRVMVSAPVLEPVGIEFQNML